MPETLKPFFSNFRPTDLRDYSKCAHLRFHATELVVITIKPVVKGTGIPSSNLLCKAYGILYILTTSSVSPELFWSQANICSRKSPFAHEGFFREPLYFVKKSYNRFGTKNHIFQYRPLKIHEFYAFMGDMT